MNPAPDAELASVGEKNHRWIVNNMSDFFLRKSKDGWETPGYRWSVMLNPTAKAKASVSSKETTTSKRTAAKPKTAKSKKA